MKRLNRNPNKETDGSLMPGGVDEQGVVMRDPDNTCGFFSPLRLMGVFLSAFMLLSVLFSVSVVLKDPPTDGVLETAAFQTKSQQQIVIGSDDTGSWEERKDKLLGGLLSDGIDEKSCISRYESILYHKELKHRPASYLISRLRTYEALNKHCGPQTKPYNRAVENLRNGNTTDDSGCKYVVWISFSGLGNRILTLASAFLYALLTNRVLIVDPGTDMTDLFCNPFPEVSWFLPSDFPLKNQFGAFDHGSPHCYGKMVKGGSLTGSNQSKTLSFVYLHLVHDYDDQDKLFFCEEDQALLQKVPWLILKTDNYFVPSLFLIPSFKQELNNLFPEKETVFHFLGRYLLHPTNAVWGLVKRYHLAYLAKANKRLGIQIRVFDTGVGPFQHVLDQILACIARENLLPELDKEDTVRVSSGNKNSIAVLLTSLSSGYLEKLRNIYWEHPTVTGEVVSIFQPSHEEHQQTEKLMHNRKAWAEIYLLSMTDKLVTSSWSTFGYVAQGLGGLKPWILYKPENRTAPDPPCQRAMSMEPCFHAPPFYDCKAKRGTDTGAIVPHVRHCEDMSWGLKLVDVKDDL